MLSRAMSPAQELLNAFTILPGALLSLLLLFSAGDRLTASNSFPMLAAVAGTCLHAPVSFLYHYLCATTIPPGYPRSASAYRRADQAMIHLNSACYAYALSGSLAYFLPCAAFNLAAGRLLFSERVRPRRNKALIALSILLYTAPVARRGCWGAFAGMWALVLAGCTCFATYPVGGWSHALFHLIMLPL
jgi:hypothetical protein